MLFAVISAAKTLRKIGTESIVGQAKTHQSLTMKLKTTKTQALNGNAVCYLCSS